MYRTAYDNFDGREFKLVFPPDEPSLAVQSARDEVDINTIVKRFGLGGVLPDNVRVPTYDDFTEVMDFQSAQNALVAARESFMAMPWDVRSRFNNDPAAFVDFCSDENNLDEMRKMGLAVPAPVEADKPLETKASPEEKSESSET